MFLVIQRDVLLIHIGRKLLKTAPQLLVQTYLIIKCIKIIYLQMSVKINAPSGEVDNVTRSLRFPIEE